MNFRLQLPPQLTACTHAAMATEFVCHLGEHEPAYLRQAATEAYALIDRLEACLSFYRESSDVTRLNRAPAGAEVSVSPETIACLELAAEAARLTGGAFDAFTGRAAVAAKKQETPVYLTGTPEPGEGDVPGPVVSLHPTAGIVRKLRSGPWLDLGALGKGYALDQAAALFAEWGITTGCLIAGGSSLRGLGGPGWPLEVGSSNTPLSLPGEFCLGASGFLFQPGHIIDSRPTPAKSSAARALVLAPSAALADALSTAALLLDDEQLAQLTRDQPRLASLVFDTTGQAHRHGPPFA
jgi:thiamine biosynthesis lipoprotein